MNHALFLDESKQAGTYDTLKQVFATQGFDIDTLIRAGVIPQSLDDFEDTLLDELYAQGLTEELRAYFDFGLYVIDQIADCDCISLDGVMYYWRKL